MRASAGCCPPGVPVSAARNHARLNTGTTSRCISTRGRRNHLTESLMYRKQLCRHALARFEASKALRALTIWKIRQMATL